MYSIRPMRIVDIPGAAAIWHDQFDRYCKNEAFPDFWSGGSDTVKRYLLEQIENHNAIVATKDEVIVGYMAWMYFDFHSERTAFLPIVGSAAVARDKNTVYRVLYSAASQIWVHDDRFNHLWMTFYNDIDIKEMLYDLGFGSYVIDACRKTEPRPLASSFACKITEATDADIDEVLALENESEDNLLRSPVFLVRDHWTRDEIQKLIHEEKVFIAWENECATGMMSVNINQQHHFEHLTYANSAGDLCAYIRPAYRGKGIGTQLLYQVCEYCRENGKPFLHVSFESANPHAIGFWPKHFKPAIRSVRRTVNKDANRAQ